LSRIFFSAAIFFSKFFSLPERPAVPVPWLNAVFIVLLSSALQHFMKPSDYSCDFSNSPFISVVLPQFSDGVLLGFVFVKSMELAAQPPESLKKLK
jgi:hypothetical protein